MKKGRFIILSGLLGIVFIVSAILKLISVEFFKLNLVETGLIGWTPAPYAARSIIGLELLLGSFLLFRIFLKGFTYPAIFFLLLLFTCYLGFEWITKGNADNCNCFGTVLSLSTVTSILKNCLLILLVVVLWKFDKQQNRKYENWLIVILSLLSFGIPYIATPVIIYDLPEPSSGPEKGKLNLELIYSGTEPKPATDLRKGRHIVAFATLKCRHCIIETYKLHLLKKKYPDLSVFIFLNGKLKDLPGYLKQTRTSDIPHMMITGKKFIPLTGYKVPSIFFLENGAVVRKIHFIQPDQTDVDSWTQQR